MSRELTLWTKKLAITSLICVTCYGMYLTRDTIFLLLISGFLTLLIIPLVEKWKKYRIPEWVIIVIVYFFILFIASVVVITIIPIIINYISSIVTQITHWSSSAQETFTKYGIKGFHLPSFLEDAITYFFDKENIKNTLKIIRQNAGSIQNFVTSQLSSLTSGGISIVSSIGGMFTNSIFIGIATFFMVLERKSIGNLFLNFTPNKSDNYIKKMYKKIQTVCTSWIKATAILGFSIFLLTYIGLIIVELIFDFKTDNVFTLALISGIMEFIPYIGPILSVIPAIIIGLGISWNVAMIILVLYIIIQQLENNFLVPYIMSKNLDISPLFVFVIMLFGATLGGIVGIFLSVPIAGILKTIYVDYLERKEKKQQKYIQKQQKKLEKKIHKKQEKNPSDIEIGEAQQKQITTTSKKEEQ